MSEKESAPLASIVSLVTEKITVRKDPSKPYIGLEHIPSSGSSLVGIGAAGDSISTNNIFRLGDTLFGKLRPRLRKSVRVNFDGYCSTDILVLRANESANADFASFVLRSEPVFAEAIRTEEGTKMPRCSWQSIREVSVFCPRSREQRRIAEILSTVDEAIEQTEALMGKWQQMKAGLMHDLFTRGVTPESHLRPTRTQAPHLYQNSPLGWIPKEWKPGLLSDYLDPNCGIKPGPFGSSLTKDIYTNSGFRIYGQEQVIGGSLEAGDYYISAHKFAEMRAFEVLEGDVLLSLVGTVGCVLVVEEPFEPGIINPRLMRLRPVTGKTSSRFLGHLLLTDGIRRQIDSLAGGGTMPVINGKVIRRLRTPLIDFKEQQRIDERIGSLEHSANSASTHLAKLCQQKQGLMHDLLTGRVRVSIE